MIYFCRYKISNWSIFWRSISLYSSRWNAIAIAQVCYVWILESLVQNLHYRSVMFFVTKSVLLLCIDDMVDMENDYLIW